ncbi:MAG: hypothetical protein FD124_655 [Alphaproteobacteria bacterium]|nr:MAG: hypothetical protein FD160_1477 [Caulobacteraceae bacterium]TPW08124.1 MAG: hypothetical protein FD124_655 [Alphaproteobacteria bacterium]
MRALLLVQDLFRARGGGQTFYRRLVNSHPDIEFVYFRSQEEADAARPANARAVQINAPINLQVTRPGIFPAYRNGELALALSFAEAVAGEAFDIVDYPDFYTFGSYLREAFAHHDVKHRAIVLSMHGNISNTIEHAWGSPGDNTLQQRQLETEQFRDADGRYSISPMYRDLWMKRVAAPVHLIDPLSVIDMSQDPVAPAPRPAVKPDLLYVGRRERLKGPDLFVEIGAWLEKSNYGSLVAVGDPVTLEGGGSADDMLVRHAQRRGVDCRFEPGRPPEDIRALFHDDVCVVLPTRFDTLNLVALEALCEGAPVALSTSAGACEYLDANHPDVPYLKIDFADWPASIAAMDAWLAEYPAHRAAAAKGAALLRARQKPLDIRGVYSDILAAASNGGQAFVPQLTWVKRRSNNGGLSYGGMQGLKSWVRKNGLEPLTRPLYTWGLKAGSTFMDLGEANAPRETVVSQRMREISEFPEKNLAQIGEKLRAVYAMADSPFYRGNLWQEIARLERLRGNDLVAATYEIRLLRVTGSDRWRYLPGITSVLEKHDKGAVAEMLAAQYGPEASPLKVRALLEERVSPLRKNPIDAKAGCAVIDDHRRNPAPVVSILVSLYNAASKMPFFLRMLERQTLAHAGKCEIIFVDANSPAGEQAAVEAHIDVLKNDYLFVRAEARETIQAAWNRALGFARGSYITCLGVDEGLYPDALERLASMLDADPAMDWAMSDSIVTQVDMNGLFVSDVMVYARGHATKESTYLDTTYVSWVGGLYRRDLHDRFGYYDSSFRAAGDTEFKMRLFRNLKVGFLDRALGVFFDYPEERTTASPIAEVEDSLAWYAYRSEGGVGYLFDKGDPYAALSLLGDCAAYRKAYLKHTSTDVELGANLARLLKTSLPDDATVAAFAEDFAAMTAGLRGVEYADGLTEARQSDVVVAQLRARWAEIERRHRGLIPKGKALNYGVTNDNRYEQHSWLWKTN